MRNKTDLLTTYIFNFDHNLNICTTLIFITNTKCTGNKYYFLMQLSTYDYDYECMMS